MGARWASGMVTHVWPCPAVCKHDPLWIYIYTYIIYVYIYIYIYVFNII